MRHPEPWIARYTIAPQLQQLLFGHSVRLLVIFTTELAPCGRCYIAVTMLSMGSRRLRFGLRLGQLDGVPVAWADVDGHPIWRVSCALVAEGRRVVLRGLQVSLKRGVALPLGGLPAGVVKLPDSGLGRVLSFYAGALPMYWAPRGARLRPGLRGLERVFPFLVGGEPPKSWARADRPAKATRGRPALREEDLLRVVAAYVKALEGRSRHPVQDAAKRLGKTPDRLRDLLHKARVRGLLTFPLQGRASGQLTPRAKALLPQKTPQTRRRR
jgi:hypothetical protein